MDGRSKRLLCLLDVQTPMHNGKNQWGPMWLSMGWYTVQEVIYEYGSTSPCPCALTDFKWEKKEFADRAPIDSIY